MTQSVTACHCLQSGRKFDFDGTCVQTLHVLDTQVDFGSVAYEELGRWSNWGNGGHTHMIHTSDANGENWMVQTAG